jgi:hypothetical protein
VSVLDTAVLASAMVVALLAGLYAGMGLQTSSTIDRRAELWFAGFMWSAALAGAYLVVQDDGSREWTYMLGIGMVNGAQVLMVAWSLLHLPNWKALQTPVPRLMPATTLVMGLLVIGVLAVAMSMDGMT